MHMQEHPNYKYRPRRKQAKRAAGPESPGPGGGSGNLSKPSGGPSGAEIQNHHINYYVPTPDSSPAGGSPSRLGEDMDEDYSPRTSRGLPRSSQDAQGIPDGPEDDSRSYFQPGQTTSTASSDYYNRYQNYRSYPYQLNNTISAMGVAKGVVMTCTNQRLVGPYEHSGIVTGTFYPPIATSQDQQALGGSTPTPMYTGVAGGGGPHRSYYAAYASPQHLYSQHPPSDRRYGSPGGASSSPLHHPSLTPTGHHAMAAPAYETTEMEEFDKYLKYGGAVGPTMVASGGPDLDLDSNHNYHQNYFYPQQVLDDPNKYQPQQEGPYVTMSPLPPNVGPSPAAGQPTAGPVTAGAAPTDPQALEDFSHILADVRKTCYTTCT